MSEFDQLSNDLYDKHYAEKYGPRLREKPLHMRVAEALGWRDLCQIGWLPINPPIPCVRGKRPEQMIVGPKGDEDVPHYDTDWSATGPLIEKYGICLSSDGPNEWEAWSGRWRGAVNRGTFEDTHQPTALHAVCHLILALHAAGKLPEVP